MEEQGRKRYGSPIFYKLLEEMADTHDKKSHDYANNSAPFANYAFAGELAVLFAHSPLDAGFVGRIGEKIFRLANLESSNRIPKNETIEDTERDIAVIAVLWMAARRDERSNQKINVPGEAVEFTVKGPGHSPIKVTEREPTMRPMTEELLKDINDLEAPQPLRSNRSMLSKDTLIAIIQSEQFLNDDDLDQIKKYLEECIHARKRTSANSASK